VDASSNGGWARGAVRAATATGRTRTPRSNPATDHLLDEPTTGLHAVDIELLMRQLHRLVESGNTVVVVEHDMGVVAGADWVVDLGPGAGEECGRVVAVGPPDEVAHAEGSRTAPPRGAARGEPPREARRGAA
jgi:excinuclease ABC subunit A